MVRVLSIAHGDLTVTFGDLPYPPVTLTASKLSEALTALDGLTLGLGDAAALLLLGALGVGDALALSAGASLPQAARLSSDALSPTPSSVLTRDALTAGVRTGRGYRAKPVPPPLRHRLMRRCLQEEQGKHALRFTGDDEDTGSEHQPQAKRSEPTYQYARRMVAISRSTRSSVATKGSLQRTVRWA